MCLGFHGHCGEKSLLCQCRTFQSASLIAGEQWVEANTRANSWSIAFFLSTYSWLPLHIYFYLSSRDTWRAHLLQKTCTAGCLLCIGARRSPEVPNMCWKADQKVQYSWWSICQGHKGQEQQMFLMLLWGLPVLLSLSPSSQNTDTAGVTGDLQLHIDLRFCGLWIVNTDLTFFSEVSWSSCSDHPFLLLFAAKDVTRAGPVRTA